MFKSCEDLKADAEKALRTRWIVNIVFYIVTFAWFVISATTGKYQWREGVNVLFFIEAILFFWSLLRIRKFIKMINTRN